MQENLKKLEDGFLAIQAKQEAEVLNVTQDMASAILSFECKLLLVEK